MTAGAADRPPPPTRIRRVSDRRAQLLEVTIGVIARRGVRGMRVQEIAKDAGVSVTLLYHYFGSKPAAKKSAKKAAKKVVKKKAAKKAAKKVVKKSAPKKKAAPKKVAAPAPAPAPAPSPAPAPAPAPPPTPSSDTNGGGMGSM